MSSRIKSLFFGHRTTNKQPTTTALAGQPYEQTASSFPPIEGQRPIAGNRTISLEHVHPPRWSGRGRRSAEVRAGSWTRNHAGNLSVESTASAQPWSLSSERPRTAPGNDRMGWASPRGTSADRSSRPQSRSSFKDLFWMRHEPPSPRFMSLPSEQHYAFPSIPTLGRKSTPTSYHQRPLTAKASAPKVSSLYGRGRQDTSHLDILDAHVMLREPQSSYGRSGVTAYGLRSYGEDVADRNIAAAHDGYCMAGTVSTPNLHDFGQDIAAAEGYNQSGKGRTYLRARRVGGGGRGDDGSIKSSSSPTSPNFPLRPQRQAYALISDLLDNRAKQQSSPNRLSHRECPWPAARYASSSTPDKDYRSSEEQQHSPWESSTPTSITTKDSEELAPFAHTADIARRPDSGPSVKPVKHKRHTSSLSAQLARELMAQQVATTGASSASGRRVNDADSHTTSQPGTGSTNRSYLVQDAAEAPSLEGVVDLTDTVDHDTTIEQRPAVVHEKITQNIHEIEHKVITREIHTHDVYHRILPIKETEILPTLHYVPNPAGDGLIQIPASKIPGLPPGETYQPGFHTIETPTSSQVRAQSSAKIIPKGSTGKDADATEPHLMAKRQTMTKDGVPKQEYLWRHPPIVQCAPEQKGVSAPLYSMGDLSNYTATSRSRSCDDIDKATMHSYGSDGEAASSSASQVEGDLLFRDTGYGSGMLPGLWESVPSPDARSSNSAGLGSSAQAGARASHQSPHFRRKTLRKSVDGQDSSSTHDAKKTSEDKNSPGREHVTRMRDLQQRLKRLGV